MGSFAAVLVSFDGVPEAESLLVRRLLFNLDAGVGTLDFHEGIDDLLVLLASPEAQKAVEGKTLFYTVGDSKQFGTAHEMRVAGKVDCKLYFVHINMLGMDGRFRIAHDSDVIIGGGGKDRYGTLSWLEEHLGITPNDFPSFLDQ